jgi:hypothetical protein
VIVVVNGESNNTDLVFTAESITSINMQTENDDGEGILADAPVIETDVHVNQGNNNLEEPPTVLDIVQCAVEELQNENVNNQTEILRKLQMVLVTGRPLEIEDETQCGEGETNFIYMDRENSLSKGFDEMYISESNRSSLGLAIFEKYVLVLIRLGLNYLTYRSKVSKTFCSVVHVLNERLKGFIYWPDSVYSGLCQYSFS